MLIGQKPTQPCETIIFQLKINKNLKSHKSEKEKKEGRERSDFTWSQHQGWP